MATLNSLADIERVLADLTERGYVQRLPRRPGQKEDRFEQLLGDQHEAQASSAPAPAVVPSAHAGDDDLESRVRALEADVALLRSELAQLRSDGAQVGSASPTT
jgi:uncharacterized protein YceH (UPF0502 family)